MIIKLEPKKQSKLITMPDAYQAKTIYLNTDMIECIDEMEDGTGRVFMTGNGLCSRGERQSPMGTGCYPLDELQLKELLKALALF